jgi:hypothetical protein
MNQGDNQGCNSRDARGALDTDIFFGFHHARTVSVFIPGEYFSYSNIVSYERMSKGYPKEVRV